MPSLLSLEQKLSQGYLDQLVWSIWISADWPCNTICNWRNVFHHVAEIARQAAQLKLMRKLEKQAMLQAAKEARRQQGTQQPWAQNSPSSIAHKSWTESCKSHFMYCRTAIMAAEEKRKKREQMKLLKQQVSVYLFVSPLENPISAATSLWASNLKLSPVGQSGQPWRNLLFLKENVHLSPHLHPLSVRHPPSTPPSFSVVCMT